MKITRVQELIAEQKYPAENEIVYVIDHQEGHGFELGEEIRVIKAKPDGDAYLCVSLSDPTESWWLNSSEFEYK
jgi:hypothetical protein